MPDNPVFKLIQAVFVFNTHDQGSDAKQQNTARFVNQYNFIQLFTLQNDHPAEGGHGNDQWQGYRDTIAVVVRRQHTHYFGVDK